MLCPSIQYSFDLCRSLKALNLNVHIQFNCDAIFIVIKYYCNANKIYFYKKKNIFNCNIVTNCSKTREDLLGKTRVVIHTTGKSSKRWANNLNWAIGQKRVKRIKELVT